MGGAAMPPRARATRLEPEHRQWQRDVRRFRNEREEQAASASLNRLAGGLEAEARYNRSVLNDEGRARTAERRAADLRRGHAIRNSPYLRTSEFEHFADRNPFVTAREREREMFEARAHRALYGRNLDGARAEYNWEDVAERRPDWERSREERRREGHESSVVHNREGYIENPSLGNVPNMIMDHSVLAHARNTFPLLTEHGLLGAQAAQRLLG